MSETPKELPGFITPAGLEELDKLEVEKIEEILMPFIPPVEAEDLEQIGYAEVNARGDGEGNLYQWLRRLSDGKMLISVHQVNGGAYVVPVESGTSPNEVFMHPNNYPYSDVQYPPSEEFQQAA